MDGASHKITGSPPEIRRLPEATANRIAAGEVVERPASAVKELVENALDAGARRVEIAIADGGKTLIRVEDDGHGIAADALALALERHATSKIEGEDLVHIASFGFRGEALPSIGSVARLRLVSRAAGAEAWEIEARAGALTAPKPAARGPGTTVEVRDLFSATPARLKFLRSERAEARAIGEVVRRLALGRPEVAFRLVDVTGGGEGRVSFRAEAEAREGARTRRIDRVLGQGFAENAVPIEAERDGIRLTGLAGLPTAARGSAVAQHFFVNGRPVRDKLLVGALRAAYRDVLARDRHPAAVLFLEITPERVDVNVHPAKAEVRFREPGVMRGLVVSALSHALAGAGHRTAPVVSERALGAFQPRHPARWQGTPSAMRPGQRTLSLGHAAQAPGHAAEGAARPGFAEAAPGIDDMGFEERGEMADLTEEMPPLGHARAQFHENYILAQTPEGIVLVDQHAAHGRLVYERLKSERAADGIRRQALLIPEVVDLTADAAARLIESAEELAGLGLVLEPFGARAVVVREVPALIGVKGTGGGTGGGTRGGTGGGIAGLVRDIADELADEGTSDALARRLDHILATIACHGSVRSGRRLTLPEMDALLRQIEATPLSGQCNHGRPTHVTLTLGQIERLFGRR